LAGWDINLLPEITGDLKKSALLKRKFSGDLKARKFLIQTKEIAGKMIVCNLHRFLQFLIVEVFYSAKLL
jgi:hypothetical protein